MNTKLTISLALLIQQMLNQYACIGLSVSESDDSCKNYVMDINMMPINILSVIWNANSDNNTKLLKGLSFLWSQIN